MDKDFLGSSDLCKKAVSPVGLGMWCVCHQCFLVAFCHPGEKLLLGENLVVLFFLMPAGLLALKILGVT